MSKIIDQARDSLGYPRGILVRASPLFLIALFASLSILMLVFIGHALFPVAKEKTAVPPDKFEKLMIEHPEKSTQAPDFTLEDLSRKRWRLKDLRGKVVFLNFWATWCVPCREEMPLIEKLHRRFEAQGLEVVAVNVREDRKAVQKFFGDVGLSFKSLLDHDGDVSDEYGAWSIPLSYVINRQGEFAGKAIGDRNWDSEQATAFFRDLVQSNH